MSDETYYTVLGAKETASLSEIKNAYRDLIKQVHPDTIANLAPYLRKIAEDKTKEITEAYGVLSNSSKRRDYDRQLDAYKRQNASQSPPPSQSAPPSQPPPPHTASTAPFGYCTKCGASLYASGYCPKCSKFATRAATSAASSPRPQAVHWLGHNWAPLIRWVSEHPIIALAIPIILVLVIAGALSSNDTSQADLNCLPSQRVEVNGRFVCQPLPRSSTPPATTPNTPSRTTATTKDKPEEQYVVVGEEDVEEAKTAKSGSVIDLRKKSVIDLRNNPTSKSAIDFRPESGAINGLEKLARDLPRNWVFVCPTDDANCKWNSPPFQVWIEGSDVHESRLTSSGGGAQEIECVTHPNGSGWEGSCLYTLTWTSPSRTCRIQASEQITKIMPSVIMGVSQRLDTTPLKDGKCPVPGAASLEFTLVPQPPRLTGASGQANVEPRSNTTTADAPAISLNPPAETRAAPRQPDLSGLTSSERRSIESACSYAKYNQGPVAYDQCLARQFEEWKTGPRQPDLSALTSSERRSIESACSFAKYNQGPAAYDRCLGRQFEEWKVGPKQPDLSGLASSERRSIESVCSYAKYNQGPAAYNRCLVKQFEALTNYRQ